MEYTSIGIAVLSAAVASMFVFATVRHIVASGIAGLVSIVLMDVALAFLKGSHGIEHLLAHLPLLVLFYTAYIVLACCFAKFSPAREEKPRLPGVLVGILALLLFLSVYYALYYLSGLPEELLYLYSSAVAGVAAMFLIGLLVRDIAKIGLALLACVSYAHNLIPEAYALYMTVMSLVSVIVTGTVVYYAYREFGSRNVDVLVKLRY